MTARRRRRPQCRPIAGFTLIEMLAALAILGLAAAVSYPLLRPSSDKLRLEAAARAMAGQLRLARARAIGANRAATLMFDAERRTYETGAQAVAELPAGIDMRLVVADVERDGAGRGGFRFFPNGASSGGEIHLTLGTRQSHITVNWLTGATKLE